MAYVKTNWVDDSAPAVSASNLNHLEQGVYDAHVTADGAIQKALADAKGDLPVGSAADSFGRLAVGSNGQVLTADSTQALGVKWAAAASAGDYAGGILAYSERTTEFGVDPTLRTVHSTTVTTPAVNASVEFWCPGYDTNQGGETADIWVDVDGVAFPVRVPLTNSSIRFGPIFVSKYYSLSAASHTFSVKAKTSNGNMWMKSSDTGFAPMFIRVIRISG